MGPLWEALSTAVAHSAGTRLLPLLLGFKLMRQAHTPWMARYALASLALASIGLYAWLALRYPLLGGLERGRATWATLGDRSLLAGLLHGMVYGLLVGVYVLALRRVARRYDSGLHDRHAQPLIWGGWLAMSAALLFAYPGESLDVFDYLFRGRMLAEYGASPLAGSPSPFSSRPFYAFITWRGQVDTYGPLWEYASGAVAWAVGRSLPQPVGETTGALAASPGSARARATSPTPPSPRTWMILSPRRSSLLQPTRPPPC